MQDMRAVPGDLADIVNDALALLSDYSTDRRVATFSPEPLPSLLELCRAMCEEAEATPPEPVRLLLHVACSGGTLIAKCLSAMPNTVLLSEIDPLSIKQHLSATVIMFTPTDIIKQLRYSRYPEDLDLYREIFLAGLEQIHRKLSGQGQNILIRAHPHSQFFTAIDPYSRQTVQNLVQSKFPTKSILTLRHPMDSYQSLHNNRWFEFEPKTLEEYSRRYRIFLDLTVNTPSIRYEDFVVEPEAVLREICGTLALPYNPLATIFIGAMRVSGDSGRSDTVIGPRPRRDIPQAIRDEIAVSPAYLSLCDQLGYEPRP